MVYNYAFSWAYLGMVARFFHEKISTKSREIQTPQEWKKLYTSEEKIIFYTASTREESSQKEYEDARSRSS